MKKLVLYLPVFLFLITVFYLFKNKINNSYNNVLPDTTSACDDTLWQHVYNPERLKMIDKCKTVSGTIKLIRTEKDGDYHIRIKLDPQFNNLLNAGNTDKQEGDLVVEPICEHNVTQEDAVLSCTNFRGNIQIPSIGSHVVISGSYVLDTEHNWMEIHPVSKLTIQ